MLSLRAMFLKYKKLQVCVFRELFTSDDRPLKSVVFGLSSLRIQKLFLPYISRNYKPFGSHVVELLFNFFFDKKLLFNSCELFSGIICTLVKGL